MPMFSERDINEAKKRVRDMQNRASHYIGDDTEKKLENKAEVKNNIPNCEPSPAESSDEDENSKSSLMILALILILSKEGADNMLILALLYLLL